MKTYTITAETRTETGKGANRRLRQNGRIPGVLYGNVDEAVMVHVSKANVTKLLNQGISFNIPFQFELNQNDEIVNKTVFIREMQKNPISDFPIHFDFYAVKQDQIITLEIDLLGKGKPVGLEEGGVFQQVSDFITVEGKVSELPYFIEVDLKPLDIGQTITAGEIQLPEGITLVDNTDKILYMVQSASKISLDLDTSETGEEARVGAAEEQSDEEGPQD